MKPRSAAIWLSVLSAAAPVKAAPFDPSHAAFDAVLGTTVVGGRVDYGALKKSPGALDAYLASLASLPASEYEGWGKEERIAFWLNAYNAQTLKAVIDNYPIRAKGLAAFRFPKNSIRQIPGVWDKRSFVVAGRTLTLEGIEHGILRKEFAEPRIHMALVCASGGCPPLRSEAYRGDRLDSQLEDQARVFLSDPKKFSLDPAAALVRVSPIFKWFGGDFVGRWGGAGPTGVRTPEESAFLRFIAAHVGPRERAFLAKEAFTVEFTDYDWSLNEKGR